MIELNNAVVATIVADEQRLTTLPHFFGSTHMLKAEALAFAYMSKLSVDYGGGYWHYYTLSNGGFFMAVATEQTMRIEWDGNGYSGELSADAAGIVATLFAISHLAADTESDKIAGLYHLLRDYAREHAEAKEILAAID